MTSPARQLDQVGRHGATTAAPDRVGQATAVEQSRAVAEVQAAVIVAQQVPRSMALAKQQMQESCQEPSLAARAFFSYTRAGNAITGPSIHLARELARCFGNVQYGINELRRDDEHRQSEMLAWAWDVQNNTRASTTFIVPHGTDTTSGRKDLTSLRDIYENNANHGARRLREQIFAILPTWFTETAKEICTATIEAGDPNKSIEQRSKDAVAGFARGGITEQQLVDRVGHPVDKWTASDIAQLEVLFTSLKNGETTKDEQFPAAARVTGDEITKSLVGEQKPPAGKKANAGQMKRIHGLLKDRSIESPEHVREAIAVIIGRPLASRRDLLGTEADVVIAKLEETGPPPPPPTEDGDPGPSEPQGDES